MRIRRYEPSDWDEWFRMNRELFPGLTIEDDEAEMRATLERSDAVVLVLERDDGSLAGYIEAGERSIADGCLSSPVGYIEAWYVDPDVRRQGYGAALVDAAEDWAREPVVGTFAVRTQDGVPAGVFFSKKLASATPCGQRIRVTQRSRRCGSSTGATWA